MAYYSARALAHLGSVLTNLKFVHYSMLGFVVQRVLGINVEICCSSNGNVRGILLEGAVKHM